MKTGDFVKIRLTTETVNEKGDIIHPSERVWAKVVGTLKEDDREMVAATLENDPVVVKSFKWGDLVVVPTDYILDYKSSEDMAAFIKEHEGRK